MSAPAAITTPRLRGHRVGPADEEFLVAMWSDPRVVATLGGARDRDQVQAMLTRLVAGWDEHGHGMWILTDSGTDVPVGWVALLATDTGGPGGVEVGWSIAADRWREGLASEAGAEAVRVAFTDVGLDALVTFTLVDNAGSRGVMEHLGFTFDGEVEHAGLPHVLYRLSKRDWEQRNHG